MNILKKLNFFLAFLLVSSGGCRTPQETVDRRSHGVLPTRAPSDLDIISLMMTISEQSSLIIWTIDEFLSTSLVESLQLRTKIDTQARPSGIRNPLDFLRQIASEVGVARTITSEGRTLRRWQSLSARRLLGSDLYIFCQPLEWNQTCSISLNETIHSPFIALFNSSLLNLGSLNLDLKQLTMLYQQQSHDRLQWPEFLLNGRLVMTRVGDVITIKGDELGWKSQSMTLQAEAFTLDISLKNQTILGFKLSGSFLKGQSKDKSMKISIQTKKVEKQGMELTFDLE